MPRMDDGFKTVISLGGTSLWEKSVTPPGMEGGGEVDTTTMRNSTWRTKNPKKLKTMSECSFTAAYDPNAYSTLLAQINTNQLITVAFPRGDLIRFWGWLDSFVPGESVEGEQPTAECTIICSNQNATGVETAPIFTAGS